MNQEGESRFEEFWSIWPTNGSKGYEDYTRKKDKKKCRTKFEKLSSRAQLAAIRDVEQRSQYDKAWKGQRGKFLSSPEVYINNERWNDGEFADIRDDKKKQAPTTFREHFDTGPDLSKYARFANLALLQSLMRKGGIGERITEVVRRKNEIVSLAECEQWENDDFKSVILKTIEEAITHSAV